MLDRPLPDLSPEDRLLVALSVVRQLANTGRPDRALLMTESRIQQELYELRRKHEKATG